MKSVILFMPSKKKVVGYFTLLGVLPVIFFTAKDISEGLVPVFEASYITSKLLGILVACITNGLISASVMFLPIAFLEKKMPWDKKWGLRLLAEFFMTEITAMLMMIVVFNFFWLVGYHDFELGDSAYWASLRFNLFITFVMNILLTSVYEGIVLFSRWKVSLIQNEKLEKDNLASKFEALKNQVNPHFLFNSLNTLSNLVHEDSEKAEDFIDEFSHIYRYVLEKKDQMVVTLQEEIEFVKSYLKLCKIRFEKGLESDIRLEVGQLEKLIPTLSLQTLVENAIKHNKITQKEPLTVLIYTNDDQILVENNYQPRESSASSTGIGLQNIKDRYSMLSDKKPSFTLQNESYIASLPLIEPS